MDLILVHFLAPSEEKSDQDAMVAAEVGVRVCECVCHVSVSVSVGE